MSIREALKRRRTTLFFEPEGLLLQREVIDALIEDACQAPSDYNLQPWAFVVVRDRERKEILYQCAYRQEMIRDAAAVVIVCGDREGWERAGTVVSGWVTQKVLQAVEGPRVEAAIRGAYEGNPHASLLLAVRNASFVAMNLMLLAAEQGIATSPMVTFSEDAVRRAFHLPERLVPVMLVAMGMPSTTRIQPPRPEPRPVSEIVFHEDVVGMADDA